MEAPKAIEPIRGTGEDGGATVEVPPNIALYSVISPIWGGIWTIQRKPEKKSSLFRDFWTALKTRSKERFTSDFLCNAY